MEKGILAVSFGTSYEETRKKTIDRIEEEMRAAFPEYRVYRAWTSRMIRRKLLQRDGVAIPDVTEALERMAAEGIREVIVQPTHVMKGYENDGMEQAAQAMKNRFAYIKVGMPLLSAGRDFERVIAALMQELHPGADEDCVLMGHGTQHHADAVYAALDYRLKDLGYEHVHVGTVEGYPTLESVLRMLRKTGTRKVALAPFMIVAGDHATNDLAGDGQDSWKSVLQREGYQVRCILKGLGEYPQIRGIFLDHVREAIAGPAF